MINFTTSPNHSFWDLETIFHKISPSLKKLLKLINPTQHYHFWTKICTRNSPQHLLDKYSSTSHTQWICSLNSLNTSTSKWKAFDFSYIIMNKSCIKKVKLWWRFTKKNLTQWGSYIIMSTSMWHMMVIKNPQNIRKYVLVNCDNFHMWHQNWHHYVWTMLWFDTFTMD